MFHDRLDFMKLWSINFHDAKLQKWATKASMLIYTIEYRPYCPHIRMPWWKRYFKNNACWGAPCRNCPISRFSIEATISIFYNEELHVRQQLLGGDGQWVIAVSYSIGIVGAVHLWEAAALKDQNLCQNCPALPYVWRINNWVSDMPFCGYNAHAQNVLPWWSHVTALRGMDKIR